MEEQKMTVEELKERLERNIRTISDLFQGEHWLRWIRNYY